MEAHRYLTAAQSAFEAKAFDAACANAALSAAISVRAVACRSTDLASDSRVVSDANDLIDALERDGKLAASLARELRALINNRGRHVVVPAERTDVIDALAVASRIAEIAAGGGDADQPC